MCNGYDSDGDIRATNDLIEYNIPYISLNSLM